MCSKLQKVQIEKGSKLHSIPSRLFSFCSKLITVDIPEESEIKTIGVEAFFSCPIKSLYIPSTVEELKEKKNLKNIKISNNNPKYKYLDENHQLIVCKSDKNNKFFDVICFANRSIHKVDIPLFIKYIGSCAFSNCKHLTSFEIPIRNCAHLEHALFNQVQFVI